MEMIKVALYARVSTDEQAERQTFEAQLYSCRQYAEREGFEITKDYVDEGVSGSVPLEDRPAGRRLIEDAASGAFNRVIVYRLDRLSRDTLGALLALKRLESLKTPVESVDERFDDSPSGQFARTVMMGVAQLEKDFIRQRTSAGRHRRVREGRYQAPTPPFGYRYRPDLGQLEVDEDQAHWVRLMFQWALEPTTGLKTIGQRLDAAGVTPPMVNHPRRKGQFAIWNWGTIAKILRHRRYIGENSYGGTPMPCPPIIDVQTFERVQAALSRRKRDSFRNTKYQYLLQHVMYCRECGARFTPRTHSGGRRTYACYQRTVHGSKAGHENVRWNFKADALDQQVKDFVYGVEHDPAHYLAGLEVSFTRLKDELSAAHAEITRLAKRLSDLDAEEARILDFGAKGFYRDEAQLVSALEKVRREQDKVRAELDEAEASATEDLTLREAADFILAITRNTVAKRGVTPGYLDEFTGEQAEPDYDEWRERVQRLVSRVWVEQDGSLTIEGPGEASIDATLLKSSR